MDDPTSVAPPPWQEPPVFNLPCVSSTKIPILPKTHAVAIFGINDATHPQIFDAHVPNFIKKTNIYCYNPYMIAGQEASEASVSYVADKVLNHIQQATEGSSCDEPIMFFAYDFGGLIVKQALVIASANEKYQDILDRTCLVVFYGMPHRSSYEQTWDVNALRVLHSCFLGTLGSWVPSYIDTFSKYQEALNGKFIKLASGFSVMNICQDRESSSGYELITDSSCASLGLEDEEKIVLKRSHYQLAFTLGYQQRTNMEGKLLNAAIRHWEFYRNFLTILRTNFSGMRKNSASPGTHGDNIPLRTTLPDSLTEAVKNASLSTKHRIVLGESLSFEEYSGIFTRHIMAPGKADDIVLHLGEDKPYYRAPLVLHQLFASLCLQLLEKQPRLILWTRHLYANLRDAVLGVDTHWKSRILARCLRNLLLVPKRGATYCLIHYHHQDHSREHIISQVLEAMKESEIPIHLFVSTDSHQTTTGLGEWNQWPCTDLSRTSGDAEGSPPLQDQPQGARSPLCVEIDSIAQIAGHDKTISLERALSGSFEWGMNWVLQAVAWISFAIHPLSVTEVEQALEFQRRENNSIPVEMDNGKSLLHVLDFALHGHLRVTEGYVWIPRLKASDLDSIWAKHWPDSPKPELWLAEACLSHAADVLMRSRDANTSEDKRQDHSSSDQDLSKYAMRYWLEHYRRATADIEDQDSPVCTSMRAHPGFDRDAWIQRLVSSSWSPGIDEDIRNKVLPSALELDYGLNTFTACDLSLQMAVLPVTAEDDFNWLLLEIAADRLPEELYYDLVQRVVGGLSGTPLIHILQRVIASSKDHLRNKLFSNIQTQSLLKENSTELVRTCIAIGNVDALTELCLTGSKLLVSREAENRIDLSLMAGLQVASEYGDNDIVDQILSHEDGKGHVDSAAHYLWNALHLACHYGNRALSEKLLSFIKREDIPVPKAFRNCPLLTTSARGLFSISDSLVGVVKIVASSENTTFINPIQLASKFGYLKTLESLMEKHRFEIPLGRGDENALCSALKSGQPEISSKIFNAFITQITARDSEKKTVPTRPNNDESDEDGASTGTASPRGYELLKEDEEKAVEQAVRVAADCGASSFIFSMLEREPIMIAQNLAVSNWHTAEIIEATNGSSFHLPREYYHSRKDLLPVDKKRRNAMHYACYHGHQEIVEYFVSEEYSLRERDSESATPMTAAANGDHYRTFQYLLLPSLQDEELKFEFRLAAKNGQVRALELILKFLAGQDSQTREGLINSKDEEGNTALHHAVSANRPRVVQQLLLLRVDLEATNQDGKTPLSIAVTRSSTESIKLLLAAGASTETTDDRGRSLLTRAIYFEEEEYVQLLLDHGALTRLGDYWSFSDSILDLTMTYSSLSVLKALLKHWDKMMKLDECRLNDTYKEGIMCPTEVLRIVVKRGSIKTLEVLFEVWRNKFDKVIWDDDRAFGSILQYTANYGASSTLEWIWKHTESQTNLNEIAGFYGTVVQAAICGKGDELEKVEMLLSWGAIVAPEPTSSQNLDTTPVSGPGPLHGYWGTALHAAAYYGITDVVKLLLKEKGVSKDQRDVMGRLPLHLALLRDDTSWDIVQELSSKSSTIHSLDSQDRNGLHIACSAGAVDFVQQIPEIDRLSLIDSMDVDGWTPLHWACRSGNKDLVSLLVRDYKANVTIRTKDQGWLPYHVAIYYECEIPDEVKDDSPSAFDQDMPTEAGILLSPVWCDFCRCSIRGERHSCSTCGRDKTYDDFDLCSKCFAHVSDIHTSGHKFERGMIDSS